MCLMAWYLVCVLAVTAMSTGEYVHTIYVDPERGHNSTACLNSSSPSQACRNLSYAFHYRNSSTHYLLQPGTHYIDTVTSFTDLRDIAITAGNGSVDPVKVVCASNSGLSFINTENISLQNLHFTRCSSQHNSTNWNVSFPTFKLLYIRSALYFSHCAAISMHRVVISESTNANAVTVYNTIGRNAFTQCVFKNNIGLPAFVGGGGGGVYIEFSYCLPGNTSCENGTEASYTDYNKHSTYTFTECSFSKNVASVARTKLFIPNKQYHRSFGQGGGLSVFFCGNATNNSVMITNCKFWENRAHSGAGTAVEFTDSSVGNSVTVTGTECSFHNNSGLSGGGMHLGHFLFDTTHRYFRGNSVSISNCVFSRNVATYGGGLQVSASRQKVSSDKSLTVLISEVMFDSNQGRYGAALGLFLLDFILQDQYPDITITDCTFRNNSIHYHHTKSRPYEVGMGAVYISELDANFHGSNSFVSNFGTALAVASARVNITDSHMVFSNNTGFKGGAISLLESARLLVNNNTSVRFSHNYAFVAGGAIYKEHSSQAEAKNCLVFHQNFNLNPNEWNARFIFEENYDSGYPPTNAIFSTSVVQCALTGIDTVFCWKHWVYSYNGVEDKNCSKFIRTAPGNITFTDSAFSEKMPFPTVRAYPGEVIELPIKVRDDLNHSLQTVFTAGGESDNGTIDANYTYVWKNDIRVLGTEEGSFELYLNAIGGRQWQVSLRIELTECPPGLLPTTGPNTTYPCNRHNENREFNSCSSCECNPEKNFARLVQCNTVTNASLASGYWMGAWKEADGNQFYVVSTCPAGFCRTERTGFILLPRTNLSEHICGVHNRKGRVCGECIEGYGPALNSDVYECIPCTLSRHQLMMHITYYILAVYVPLFLMFLALIVFNIQLTTGPANAFILYSQVISSTMNLNADGRLSLDSVTPHIDLFLKAFKFPYGIFNLKFFEHFVPLEYMCLGAHLNVLDIFLLDFLVAFFPLLMVIAITILYRIVDYCPVSYNVFPRCKRGPLERLRNSLIPAFASFILLSYTKFSLTSSCIFSYVTQHNASGHFVPPVHVNFAAQYAYNDTEYIVRYVLPASVVFLTFVAIPPLVLLDRPLRLFETVVKLCPCIWRYYPYDKMRIMLDAFQSCYENRYRCFAGLYFVFRLLINITNALCDDLRQFILQEVYCIVFALLVGIFKPYKKNYHFLNYVDSLIFLNLAVTNLISLFLYADTRKGTDPSTVAFAFLYILVFLPLLWMVSYVVWCVLPISSVLSRVRNWPSRWERSTQRTDNLIQDMSHESISDVDWERAEAKNNYSPPETSDLTLHSSTPTPTTGAYSQSRSIILSEHHRYGLSKRQSYGSINV